MANLTIEDVPDELCRTFRAIAPERRRLVVSRLVACLENEVRVRPARDVERTIQEIRAFRESLNVPPLTEEFIERAINEGRP
ncbi:MAG: hypothetical protein AVDCRST_MAG91-2482 [uncultured Sphingomonadaceae bacterium]|uniref:Uncharacterized protein n=1 Tax=uncultured Sphingomonadaceae bacterium TaxID=169976 RepID=A0A6J4TLL1_9SPHN|nr:MAG: hypothetical protein AVDCRST_MAG91-2482 [uncultured Sphingomonadaceae bacterium]